MELQGGDLEHLVLLARRGGGLDRLAHGEWLGLAELLNASLRHADRVIRVLNSSIVRAANVCAERFKLCLNFLFKLKGLEKMFTSMTRLELAENLVPRIFCFCNQGSILVTLGRALFSTILPFIPILCLMSLRWCNKDILNISVQQSFCSFCLSQGHLIRP